MKKIISLKIGNLTNTTTRKINEIHLFSKHFTFYFKITTFNVFKLSKSHYNIIQLMALWEWDGIWK